MSNHRAALASRHAPERDRPAGWRRQKMSAEKKRRPGRPRKKESEKRTHVALSMSPAEHTALRRAAKKAKTTVSAYVRAAVACYDPKAAAAPAA